jgi:hypothetical protein
MRFRGRTSCHTSETSLEAARIATPFPNALEVPNVTATDPTDAETACFEAGVKFGSLYHQFAGTPIAPESASSLATAMEEAIENQPHCRSVAVDVRTDDLEAAIDDAAADYTELTGRFLDVEIVVDYEGCVVVARMEMEEGYPLMRVEDVRT